MTASRHRRWLVAALVLVGLTGAACGDGGATAGQGDDRRTLRLGHFPNITHATAIVGVENGIFEEALGEADAQLDIKTFNAGPAAVEALFSGGLDATYIGPNPAINAFARSDGEAIRIIAGATSGGAFLVVKPGIDDPEDLRGKTLASPQLGNTQDVALRAWLEEEGLETDSQGGGDVSIKPQENAQTLETFRSGDIDGAWVPEPWATRLIQEGGGEVLVDERDLWPNERYVTTHLIVRTEFLESNPEVVEALLRGHLEADAFVRGNTDEAKRVVNAGIGRLTDKPLPAEVLDAAWESLEFTVDPVAASLAKSAEDAIALGLLEEVDLEGIYHLDPLNTLLEEDGREPVTGL